MASKLKRIAIYAGGVTIGLAVLTGTVVYAVSESRLRRDYGLYIDIVPVAATEAALIEEGGRLAYSRGCTDCHGEDFAGKVVVDEMPFGRLVGANLTHMPRGHEGASVHERMLRALHHGVDMNSRALLMMPSDVYSNLSQREVAALSAYFASLTPIQRDLPESTLGPLGRALLVFGKLEGFLSVEVIDHAAKPLAEPPPKGSLAYGRHAAQLCTGCHGAGLSGGALIHGDSGLPRAANLTPHSTGLAGWTERDFVVAMRSGLRPDGSEVNAEAMPWRVIGRASDLELHSIWLYLRSLPPVDRDIGAARR